MPVTYSIEDKCQASIFGSQACPIKALPGTKFCRKHTTGRKHKTGGPKDVFGHKLQYAEKNSHNNPTKEQMGFFRKHIGPKLTALLDEALEIKMFDVQEELAIVRTTCIQQVQVYNSLQEIWANPATRPVTPEAIKAFDAAIAECGSQVKSAMNDITFQVERQAKIHSMVAEKIHPNAIADVVRQINRMVFECFGQSDWKGVERFNNMLTTELELPSLKNQGTTITPDKQVQMMDESVPLYVEEVQLQV